MGILNTSKRQKSTSLRYNKKCMNKILQFTKAQWVLLAINIVSVVLFGAHFVRAGNAEFIAYAISIVVIVGALYATLHISRFPTHIIAGITLWGIMHMMGGSVQTADGVLYAWRIYPFFDGGGEFYILKYDQFVHAFLYGVVGLMFLHLLREVVAIKTHRVFIAIVAVLAAAGFSIINEMIEFGAVVTLPETGVGGYYNTVLDMIFNFAGAVLAVTSAEILRRK